jgi:hypothetical protein
MNILHILNGDSTLYGFEQTGLDGDTMVWRGVLSEGPLEENVTSGSFWRARLNWICETLNETPAGYQERMLDQLVKLGEPYDEINLWFEFDLHCQVNLLGVMNYLKKLTNLSGPSTYLICPADYPGKENFRGMGELKSDELEVLYDEIRVQLSVVDFIIAEEVWQIYISRDAERLEKYINDTQFWGSLHLLKPALEAHLKRLKYNENGLNYVEQKLLDIFNSGITAQKEIYAAFWETEKIYGMGDMEINIYLKRLQDKGLIKV